MNTSTKSMSFRIILSAFILSFTLNACGQNVPSTIAKPANAQITPKGDKTKFSIGVSQDGNTAYVLKMTLDDINKEKMNVAFEVWDLNPKKPSIFGQEIKNLYEFFVVFIILAGVASVLLFFLSKTLLKMMHGLR